MLACCRALILLALMTLIAACGAAAYPPDPPDNTITVFAAASLTDAFEAIAAAFEEDHPTAQVVLNVAGSQQLAAQINEGAPADVFASANPEQMERVIANGRIAVGSEQVFARNRLVVITPADNPADISTLTDLARPGLRLVLANQNVPAGRYSLAFLDKATAVPTFGSNYQSAVLSNVVSLEENVRLVLTKVALGEADAGIVYSTDAVRDPGRVQQINIPDELNTIAAYPIAPIADSPNPTLARTFTDFVLGATGQAILAEYGFLP